MRVKVRTEIEVSPEHVVDGSFAGAKRTPQRLAAFIIAMDAYACDWKATEICWEYFEKLRVQALKEEGKDWLDGKKTRDQLVEELRRQLAFKGQTLTKVRRWLREKSEELATARAKLGNQAEVLLRADAYARDVQAQNQKLQDRMDKLGEGPLDKLRVAVKGLEDLAGGDPDHPASKVLERVGLQIARGSRP